MEKAKFELGDIVSHIAGDYMSGKLLVVGVGPMTTPEGTSFIYQLSTERNGQVVRVILNEYEIKRYEK
jgi:hypothetical protein